MENRIKQINDRFDREWMEKHIIELWKLELPQTFPAYHRAANYVYDLLKKEGFEAEKIPFPADGKTVFYDYCAPMAWDVSNARLTVLTPIPKLADPVIADYSKNTLSVSKYSVSLPPEGLVTRIVTEAQMRLGMDCKGAFVLLDTNTRPGGEVLTMLLDLGAVGWICDYLENPLSKPDCISWVNWNTENTNWHIQADDRDFVGYIIPPKVGMMLREAASKGVVKIKAECDGRRYEDVIHAVTATLPGKSDKEIWVYSHLYEPLIDDNSFGVIGSIEMLRVFRDMIAAGEIPAPEYTIRVAFSLEMYGTAMMGVHYGGDLRDRVIAVISTDAAGASKEKNGWSFRLHGAPDDLPFGGTNLLFYQSEVYKQIYPQAEFRDAHPYYNEDLHLDDPAIGAPGVWVMHGGLPDYLHHNSWLTAEQLDMESGMRCMLLSAAWVSCMAAFDPADMPALAKYSAERAASRLYAAAKRPVRADTDPLARMEYLHEIEKRNILDLNRLAKDANIEAAAAALPAPAELAKLAVFDTEKTETPWFDYTANFVFGRLMRGFPKDLKKLPYKQRSMQAGYSYLRDIIAIMDGKSTLQECLRRAEWRKGGIASDADVKKMLFILCKLANAGYFTMEEKKSLTAAGLVASLREVGVREGDILVVHSSMSGLGYLQGGAETVLNALLEAVGETGTILAPSFTRPYISFGGDIYTGNSRYRPFDPKDIENIHTGALPKAMLHRPDMHRSAHATHSWVALGAQAKECTERQGMLDNPTDVGCPLEEAMKRGGKVLFLGCTTDSNTFLHYVETIADVPYLTSALLRYKTDKGDLRTALIEKHLPGDRSFYRKGKYYEEAVERGLRIQTHPYGMATLHLMDLQQLYDITMDMLKDDPLALLCKNPNCAWCSKYRNAK